MQSAEREVRASLPRLLRSFGGYDNVILFARSQNDFPPTDLVLQTNSSPWTFLTRKPAPGSKLAG
jgi:hypothetical protein